MWKTDEALTHTKLLRRYFHVCRSIGTILSNVSAMRNPADNWILSQSPGKISFFTTLPYILLKDISFYPISPAARRDISTPSETE
jgi:hypothetical protein